LYIFKIFIIWVLHFIISFSDHVSISLEHAFIICVN